MVCSRDAMMLLCLLLIPPDVCAHCSAMQLLALQDLDAALISTGHAALALPMLLAQQPHAIRGPVYATLAALDIAQHLASELAASAASTLTATAPAVGVCAASCAEAGVGMHGTAVPCSNAAMAAMLGVSDEQQANMLAHCWRGRDVRWEQLGEGSGGPAVIKVGPGSASFNMQLQAHAT